MRSAGASPAQVSRSGPPGSECCVRRQRCRTRSVNSGCVGCGSEPRNDETGGAEIVPMVERNMCNAVMRGVNVPPGSRATSRANGSHRKLGGLGSRRCAACPGADGPPHFEKLLWSVAPDNWSALPRCVNVKSVSALQVFRKIGTGGACGGRRRVYAPLMRDFLVCWVTRGDCVGGTQGRGQSTNAQRVCGGIPVRVSGGRTGRSRPVSAQSGCTGHQPCACRRPD